MTRILLADDSWLSRQMISRILKDENFEFVEASDGVEALDKAAACRPDCILLDLLMPEMDGFGVLAQMRERNMSIPVIVLSADSQSTSHATCLQLGAAGMLNKPPDKAEMIDAIRHAIAGVQK